MPANSFNYILRLKKNHTNNKQLVCRFTKRILALFFFLFCDTDTDCSQHHFFISKHMQMYFFCLTYRRHSGLLFGDVVIPLQLANLITTFLLVSPCSSDLLYICVNYYLSTTRHKITCYDEPRNPDMCRLICFPRVCV